MATVNIYDLQHKARSVAVQTAQGSLLYELALMRANGEGFSYSPHDWCGVNCMFRWQSYIYRAVLDRLIAEYALGLVP
jgi:hypothetical protein